MPCLIPMETTPSLTDTPCQKKQKTKQETQQGRLNWQLPCIEILNYLRDSYGLRKRMQLLSGNIIQHRQIVASEQPIIILTQIRRQKYETGSKQ